MIKLLIGKKPTGQAPVRGLYIDGVLSATYDHLMDYKDFEYQLQNVLGNREYTEVAAPEVGHVLGFEPTIEADIVPVGPTTEELLAEIAALKAEKGKAIPASTVGEMYDVADTKSILTSDTDGVDTIVNPPQEKPKAKAKAKAAPKAATK